jgi:hypothetical protein
MSPRVQPVALRIADSPQVEERAGRISDLDEPPGERAEFLRQCEVFWELIQGCAQAGAGSLTTLSGGVRYLSADGAVMVTITDRRWL